MGRGCRNSVYAVTITVASFAPIFTKFGYVSLGNGEKTQVMGGRGTR